MSPLQRLRYSSDEMLTDHQITLTDPGLATSPEACDALAVHTIAADSGHEDCQSHNQMNSASLNAGMLDSGH